MLRVIYILLQECVVILLHICECVLHTVELTVMQNSAITGNALQSKKPL